MQITTEDRQGQQLYLGRQPILDRNRNIVAFELLFRSAEQTSAAEYLCGTKATVTVINYTFNELGMDTTLGTCRGFINVDETMLADDVIELLPKSKIVFEILETVEITEEIIERCRHLKALGYQLAMDDVICFNASYSSLLQYIDIIKVDIEKLDLVAIEKLVACIRKHKPDIDFLAEKVETQEQYERCLELGFHLFQGYFFAKPQLISGRRMSQSQITILKLLEQVLGDAELQAIEKTLKENASLSISLLKIVNSAGIGARREISSIREAVTILGRRQLKRWIQLLLYANSGQEKLSPLLLVAASRGRTMEMAANGKGDTNFEDQAFITGLLSLIDALLGMPLNEAIAQIRIKQDIVDAILDRKGELGKLLRLVEHVEEGDEQGIQSGLSYFPHLEISKLLTFHADSLEWANAVCQNR